MKAYSLNPDINNACETLFEALGESTDSTALECLSTTELMELQNHINEMLIKRFKALQKGVVALMQVDDYAFNDRTPE